MKSILSVIFLFIISTSCIAQYNVSGSIKDNKENAVSLAKIEIIAVNDTVKIRPVQSGIDGAFSIKNIKNGNYILIVSAFSFQEYKTDIVIENKDLNISPIVLVTDNVLKEVVISTKKQQMVQKTDRLVVNVEGTPIGISGSALEVLQRMPGVDIGSNGSAITLNGKTEVGIMINDKLVRVPIASLLQMLSSTNAKDIDKIELISNPPSKYDAEFTGGLINIKQIKKNTEGTNGGVLLGVGYGKKDKEKAGINWNTRKKDINFFGDLNFDRNNNPRQFTNSSTILSDNNTYYNKTISDRYPVINGYSGRLGLDYYIDDKTTLGLLVNGNTSRFKQEVFGNTALSESTGNNSSIVLFNDEDSQRDLFSTNINFNKKIDDSQTLNLDVDYLNYYNGAPNNYQNTYFDASGNEYKNEIFSATKKTPVNVWVGKVDYSKEINKNVKFDLGSKYTNSNLENTVLVQDLINDEYIKNEEFSEKSDLVENIAAVYSSMDWKANDKTDIKLGLRYEYSTQDLNLLTKGNVLDSKLSELFPSFFLSRKLNKNNTLQFSYGRRISRPTYFDLAPFVLFLDPNTYYFGNIELKPSISNALSTNYQYKKYIVSLEYTIEKNAIARSQATFPDNTAQQVLTSLNIDYLKVLNFSLSLPFKISNWWDMQNNLQLSYLDQKMDDKKEDDTFYVLRTSQNFTLPKDFSIQVFASYNSKRISGVSRIDDFQRVNLSIDKKIPKWDSRVQLSFSDIFGRDYSFESTDNLNSSYVLYSYEPRIIRLTFTYNFGNNKLKKQRKREIGSDEIKERID
ncbi:outer membrane beta-barrel family protein [Flavobacterium soyae]|uniref:outer membrane beta-barrel family protein n=1 Tax=Flavobacterium soyae TaxID=2903098 RepID=UPI001E40E145|nr:outer membrane beta-barrel family protein [Flavobacterium soyae]MCD9574049.1 TonB-dependent receptor [Flavobacterium soyae]